MGDHEDWPGLVSVVVPVRNGAATIALQFEALADQDYDGPWEVVVSDNGSTDATRSVVDEWSAKLPGLRVVDSGGANFGVDRAVWEAIDGWDERLLFAEDIDFSWRAQLAGHELLTAPGAVVHYRLRPTMRGITRQALNWGRGEAELYAAHRANGFHRRRLRHVARAYGSIARRAPRALVSRPERGRWCRDLAWRVGRLSGSARQRVWFP